MSDTSNRDKLFFEQGFDAVTLTKLDIYARYLQEWLPVPLSGRMRVKEAVIFDLFCGPGSDAGGLEGSPLRARRVVEKNEDLVRGSNVSLRLVFNDYDKEHVVALRACLGQRLVSKDGNVLASVEYHAERFEDLFPQIVASIDGTSANLLFIDQFGATRVDEGQFRTLHALKMTDVLFFVSSDWFRRFAGQPEAAGWGISKEEIMQVHYNQVHRFMADHFRKLVGGDYYVAPFSLKKGSNIYGLVFASHNHLGLKKFLDVAWKEDPHTGEANFDMFGEGAGNRDQVLMFEVGKISEFQADLKKRILDSEFASDREIYLHMLQSGFINKHARPVVRKLIANQSIDFELDGVRVQPRLSPPSCKDPRQLVFPDNSRV